MATPEECERAFHELAAMLSRVDAESRRKTVLDRSVSCTVRDLGVIFAGELRDGGLHDIRRADRPDAQVRFSIGSDDLVKLAQGELSFARAWSSGKLRIDANIFDLLKLRSLF